MSEITTPFANVSAELPPLRLHHLFVWTAVAALLLGTQSITTASEAAISPVHVSRWWLAVVSLPSTLWQSLAVTCFIFGMIWRRCELHFPSQPGHGIVIASAVDFAYSTVVNALLAGMIGATPAYTSDGTRLMWFLEWTGYVECGLAAAFSLYFAWWTRPARRWQVFFALQVVFYSLVALEGYLNGAVIDTISNLELVGPMLASTLRFVIMQVPYMIPFSALVAAVVIDRSKRVRRHWSHWVGIASCVAYIPWQITALLINAGWLSSPFSTP